MSGYPSAPSYPEYPARPQEYPARPPEYQAFPAMPAMHMPMPEPYPPMPMPMPQGPPPPPVYCPAAPAITVQPPMMFGPESVTINCPHCHCMISTETTKTHATCTHLCCLLMFCSVGLAICSCLPYFCCDPEAVEHSCPNCHAKLGEWYP